MRVKAQNNSSLSCKGLNEQRMSLDKTKCDPELGLRVREYLISKGVETPHEANYLNVDNKTKILQIEKHMSEVLKILGYDLSDDSLEETPNRIAKMQVLDMNWGMKPEYFPKCTTVDNKMSYDEMVIERGVSIISQCEHHMAIIDGKATIAYIPNKKVLGLSKINRIAEYFSRRFQIQERLTEQIYHSLSYILETEHIAVMIDAAHYCVRARGVEDMNSRTVTSRLGGTFKEQGSNARAEFLAIANQSIARIG